jgi:pilus assembly protein CpaF
VDENRCAQGYFCATGIRPQCLARLEIMGVRLPPEMFESKMLKPTRHARAG